MTTETEANENIKVCNFLGPKVKIQNIIKASSRPPTSIQSQISFYSYPHVLQQSSVLFEYHPNDNGFLSICLLANITVCPFLCSQVRVTNLEDAAEHIGEVLKRVKKEHLFRAYRIKDW